MDAGTQLGNYEIIELLGAGGMGEVYRARDPELNRDIAIKILPHAFADDPERLARFRREAQVLASLRHPNIAVIHELSLDGDIKYLVLELVEGKDLGERLGDGPFEVDDALSVCRQIAEALEEAHANGVVHRDLKPENVRLTPDGVAKVLDFGLAKTVEGAVILSGSTSSTSMPTAVVQTQTGMLMGTISYMSPEQARGKPVDKRTDIWAFGCVLFKLLTNRPPFAGETPSDIVAAILTAEPDWDLLPVNVPTQIRTLLRRCLTKDIRRRLRDIGDAWAEIDEVLEKPEHERMLGDGGGKAPNRRGIDGRLAAVALVVSGVMLAAALYVSLSSSAPRSGPSRTLSVLLPDTVPIETRRLGPADPVIAVSPDGSHLLYVAGVGEGRQLAIRDMSEYGVTLIPGTEDAKQPFFSRDGQWIGFFSFGELKKVPVGGGAPLRIADAPSAWGGTWTEDGRIVFTPSDSSGLFVVRDDGSEEPVPLTRLNEAAGEVAHDFPYLLPDGDTVLYSVFRGEGNELVAKVSLSSGETEPVFANGGYPRYVPPGFLVYGRGDGLLAVPFDLSQGRVTGPPVAILADLLTDSSNIFPHFDISQSGTLAYVPGGADASDRGLVWYSRRGQNLGEITGQRGHYSEPRLSPDATKVALVRATSEAKQVSVFDLVRGTFANFSHEGDARRPQWSPDGLSLAFTLSLGTETNIYTMPADGSEAPRPMSIKPGMQNLSSWSRDGKWIAFRLGDPVTGDDVWVAEIGSDADPVGIATTGFREAEGAVSPGGRWVAYSSNESGRSEVYVRPVTGSGKFTISDGGGTEPLWSVDGSELFYRSGRDVVAVAIETSPRFRPGPPEVLFRGPFADGSPTFDVHPDGDRFLMLTGGERAARPVEVVVVTNWFEQLLRQIGQADD